MSVQCALYNMVEGNRKKANGRRIEKKKNVN